MNERVRDPKLLGGSQLVDSDPILPYGYIITGPDVFCMRQRCGALAPTRMSSVDEWASAWTLRFPSANTRF